MADELDISAASPGDKTLVSGLFDTLKALRLAVKTAFMRQHHTKGQHNIPYGNTASRVESLHISDDEFAGYDTLQYYDGAGWKNVQPGLRMFGGAPLKPSVFFTGLYTTLLSKSSKDLVFEWEEYLEDWEQEIKISFIAASLQSFYGDLDIDVDVETVNQYSAVVSPVGTVNQSVYSLNFNYTPAAAGWHTFQIKIQNLDSSDAIPLSWTIESRRA